MIPIHPLLIELRLLERMQELMDKGEERLFPEWDVYVRKDGTRRWSQPLSNVRIFGPPSPAPRLPLLR